MATTTTMSNPHPPKLWVAVTGTGEVRMVSQVTLDADGTYEILVEIGGGSKLLLSTIVSLGGGYTFHQEQEDAKAAAA